VLVCGGVSLSLLQYSISFLVLFFLVLLVKRVFFFSFLYLFVCFLIREKTSKLTKKQQRQKEIKSKAGIYERGMRTCFVNLFFSSPRDSFFFDGAAKLICRKLYTIQASYPVINSQNAPTFAMNQLLQLSSAPLEIFVVK